MSHFSVLVIQKQGVSNPDIDEILAPYDENLEVEPYIDRTYEDIVNDAKNLVEASIKREDLKEGSELAKIVATYKAGKKISDKEYHDFLVNYYKMDTDEEGNQIVSYNPDAKWDWYEIGGRWSGELILRNGEKADQAYVRNIDLKKMFEATPEQLEYANTFWKYYVEGEEYPGTKEELESKIGHPWYKQEYYKEKYKTLAGYIKAQSEWHTYAVVDADGSWYEPGQMGWFGCSAASTEEEQDWESGFYDRFLKDLPQDAVLTIVDCHI